MTFTCVADQALTNDELRVFDSHLREQGITDNVFRLFGQWVERSTPSARFFYLKVYDRGELEGVGLFVRLKPYDIRSSFIKLRKHVVLRHLAHAFALLTRNCVYTTFQILVTSNLARPFFFRNPGRQAEVLKAMLGHLSSLPDADSVSIIDPSVHSPVYESEGFEAYPSPSLSRIDATRYSSISQYLNQHRNLKRNLCRISHQADTEVREGPLTGSELEEIEACVRCSIENTKVYMPCQSFFERNVFTSDAYRSNDFIHILVRVDGRIAGFHTFQKSGSHLGGVLGGFNRECSQKHFVYERVMVKALEYAIENGYERVYFSIIDNLTKLRLVTDTEPCNLHFHSRSKGNRDFFRKTFPHSDVNALHLLETGTGSGHPHPARERA